MSIIAVNDLVKTFIIEKKKSGIKGFVKNIINPEIIKKQAVDSINFNIQKGEIVGFLGPNGAGKSTTIKMMTGILIPTSGSVEVNGIIPYENRRRNSQRIGVVFGQKTQLWWNLPATSSFELLKAIYRIPDTTYRQNLNTFTEILELDKFINVPVRQLSLGQRMRVEIAASLLHNPDIVYLDEPTIGLDIIAKERIREFILEINRSSNVTVILTTHDMSDVEMLCQRLIIINKGKIVVDGSVKEIISNYGQGATLTIELQQPNKSINISNGNVIKTEGKRVTILFDKSVISAVDMVNCIAKEHTIIDFALHDADIEDVIKRIYNSGVKESVSIV